MQTTGPEGASPRVQGTFCAMDLLPAVRTVAFMATLRPVLMTDTVYPAPRSASPATCTDKTLGMTILKFMCAVALCAVVPAPDSICDSAAAIKKCAKSS